MKAAVTEPDQRHRVDCAVIIVTYNSARDIAGLLDSLPAAAAGLTLRVIVVDNGSADDTVERVRDHPKWSASRPVQISAMPAASTLVGSTLASTEHWPCSTPTWHLSRVPSARCSLSLTTRLWA